MKRALFTIIITLAAVIGAYAGTVETVTGKVDVLIGGSWKKATVGMNIPDGTKIMTAIDSSVKIKTTGGFFQVKELSMVTFHEQTSDSGSRQAVNVQMGTVNVQFQRVQGTSSSFDVQTPRGTASIRGTWEEVTYYPMTGMQVNVIEGLIVISDNHGNSLPLTQDQLAVIAQASGITATDDLLEQYFGENGNLYHDAISQQQMNEILQNLFQIFGNFINSNEPERL